MNQHQLLSQAWHLNQPPRPTPPPTFSTGSVAFPVVPFASLAVSSQRVNAPTPSVNSDRLPPAVQVVSSKRKRIFDSVEVEFKEGDDLVDIEDLVPPPLKKRKVGPENYKDFLKAESSTGLYNSLRTHDYTASEVKERVFSRERFSEREAMERVNINISTVIQDGSTTEVKIAYGSNGELRTNKEKLSFVRMLDLLLTSRINQVEGQDAHLANHSWYFYSDDELARLNVGLSLEMLRRNRLMKQPKRTKAQLSADLAEGGVEMNPGPKTLQCRNCAFHTTNKNKFHSHISSFHKPLQAKGKASEDPAVTRADKNNTLVAQELKNMSQQNQGILDAAKDMVDEVRDLIADVEPAATAGLSDDVTERRKPERKTLEAFAKERIKEEEEKTYDVTGKLETPTLILPSMIEPYAHLHVCDLSPGQVKESLWYDFRSKFVKNVGEAIQRTVSDVRYKVKKMVRAVEGADMYASLLTSDLHKLKTESTEMTQLYVDDIIRFTLSTGIAALSGGLRDDTVDEICQNSSFETSELSHWNDVNLESNWGDTDASMSDSEEERIDNQEGDDTLFSDIDELNPFDNEVEMKIKWRQIRNALKLCWGAAKRVYRMQYADFKVQLDYQFSYAKRWMWYWVSNPRQLLTIPNLFWTVKKFPLAVASDIFWAAVDSGPFTFLYDLYTIKEAEIMFFVSDIEERSSDTRPLTNRQFTALQATTIASGHHYIKYRQCDHEGERSKITHFAPDFIRNADVDIKFYAREFSEVRINLNLLMQSNQFNVVNSDKSDPDMKKTLVNLMQGAKTLEAGLIRMLREGYDDVSETFNMVNSVRSRAYTSALELNSNPSVLG